MIFASLDSIGEFEIESFDELLNIPEISKFCQAKSFVGFRYNTVDNSEYVLFLEYSDPIGFMRIGTFKTDLKKLNIQARD